MTAPKALDLSMLEDMGLEAEEIQRHQNRILKALRHNTSPFFPIIDTCRIDNGGILPLPSTPPTRKADGFVAFIPAAGAASRYSEPLHALKKALEDRDRTALDHAVAHLIQRQARQWALPASVDQLLALGAPLPQMPSEEAITQILKALEHPKGLFPSEKNGPTFLAVKNTENERLPGIAGQIFVVAPEKRSDFVAVAAQSHFQLNTHFLEQGPSMSTLRFDMDGNPLVEQGKYSLVPAGHGTLIKLWPEAKHLFPQAHSLFIRNIDNVAPQDEATLMETFRFLNFHTMVLENINRIRKGLDTGKIALLLEGLNGLLPHGQKVMDQQRENTIPSLFPHLWHLQHILFQMSSEQQQFILQRWNGNEEKALRWVFHRPVNTLGQVPNSGSDIGGTVAFIKTAIGQEKVCLELPHASPEDVTQFLRNPAKATHFNPVFVAAELIDQPDVYTEDEHSFWILARKKYQGQPVLYYETVLFELLGNNFFANATFPAIPRSLFSPHKTLDQH